MQKLLLSIPEPCHQNWQHMTPTNQGRFCNTCAKEVVDFSMMTDIQVLNYFTNSTHENVCGRALPEQLDRAISRPAQPKKRLFWYWNYIVMCFMFFGKGNTAKAQGSVKPVVASVLNVNDKVVTVAGYAVRRTTQTINGKVTDIDGNPVSFATVKIKGKPTGISADANGGYSIKANSNVILVISGAGFKEAEVVVGSQSFISTVMEKGGIDIKEVVVTAGHRHARFIRKVIAVNTDSLYVIDSLITTKAKADNLNPDDISGIVRLNRIDAAALYGSEASNGAIVITTRKAKEIKMKELVVTSAFGTKCTSRMGATSYTNTYEDSFLGDTIATVKTILTNSIKVYPNPVQRNTGFSVALKLKQAGNYSVQITDASGRILLQQRFYTTSKNHTEKIVSDSRWAGGVYYIRVFDAQNKLISKSSFIIQ